MYVSVLVMRCNMLLPLFSKSTYIYQTRKKQIKTSSSISAPAAAEELRVTEFTIQRREETRQEVYTAAAAASLTHALQAVHVHSSWPGLRVFAQL